MEKPTSRFVEIERKYLVAGDGWRDEGESVPMYQGYLTPPGTSGLTVRCRIAGEKGLITIKGPRNGISRVEFEYHIPRDEASEMIELMCDGRVVEKTRHRIPYEGMVWEVDEFHGKNEGLIIAEIELQSEDQQFAIPSWIGKEVTDDRRFGSSALSRYPYSLWKRKKA